MLIGFGWEHSKSNSLILNRLFDADLLRQTSKDFPGPGRKLVMAPQKHYLPFIRSPNLLAQALVGICSCVLLTRAASEPERTLPQPPLPHSNELCSIFDARINQAHSMTLERNAAFCKRSLGTELPPITLFPHCQGIEREDGISGARACPVVV